MDNLEINLLKPTANKKRSIIPASSQGTNKHNYPILEYQEKFKSNFAQMKSSLTSISGNITNYKHEIAKLEDFLIIINEHEKNYNSLIKKYTTLKKILEESIEIENLIAKLSTNQQIINISEYVNLHANVREIIKFFQNSNLMDKKDFENNMIKLMWRGFKAYEETFYVILKRYDMLESNQNTENERLNLLNKINSLAECLQDDLIKFDFTTKLIKDRRDKILLKFDDLKLVVPKNLNDDNYEKNRGLLTLHLIESEKLFSQEKEYIYKILNSCNNELKEMVYSNIIEIGLERILQLLKDSVAKHNKGNIKRIDFYQNLDILNIWNEKIYNDYRLLVERFNKDIFDNINSIIKLIETLCYRYIDDFIKDIMLLNEKIENENVLKTCNDYIFFLSHFLQFDVAFEILKNQFQTEGKTLSIESIIEEFIKRLESKSTNLEKKYSPLKYIFLINNVYFIQSKIYHKPFNKFVSKIFADFLTNIINKYINSYLNSSWSKIQETTFNEKENQTVLVYETDGKTLKNSSKEVLKKKFATFNETMKINLKFQQHIQIIDPTLEKKLIESNIETIANKYQEFYERFNDTGFTKFRNKYIIYTSANEVIQDLKLYFMADIIKK